MNTQTYNGKYKLKVSTNNVRFDFDWSFALMLSFLAYSGLLLFKTHGRPNFVWFRYNLQLNLSMVFTMVTIRYSFILIFSAPDGLFLE